MLTQILDCHSGRGIALCRVVLALIFLIVLVFDPGQPVRYIAAAYGLLGGYAALSVGLLLVVWTERTGDVIRIISARRASPGEARHYRD